MMTLSLFFDSTKEILNKCLQKAQIRTDVRDLLQHAVIMASFVTSSGKTAECKRKRLTMCVPAREVGENKHVRSFRVSTWFVHSGLLLEH